MKTEGESTMFKYIKFKELPVTNQERARQFYTEKLGLRVAQDAPYYEDDLRHDDVALTKHPADKRQQIVTVIWDTWLKPGTEEEGLRLTRQVWFDMQSFDGYVSHQIFIDQDAP